MSSFEPLGVSLVVLLLASFYLFRAKRARVNTASTYSPDQVSMASQEQSEEPPAALLADTLDPSTALPQTQSPLFTIVPPEIRNRIFSLALRFYDDKAKPYEKGVSCSIGIELEMARQC